MELRNKLAAQLRRKLSGNANALEFLTDLYTENEELNNRKGAQIYVILS